MLRRKARGGRPLAAAIGPVASAVAAQQDLPPLLDAVLEQLMASLAARAVYVYLVEPAGQALSLAGQRGLSAEVTRPMLSVSLGAHQLAARAASTREVQWVEDVEAQSPSALDGEVAASIGARCLVAVPFFSAGEVAGVLGFGLAAPRRATTAELAAVRAVGDILATGIARARATAGVLSLRVETISQAGVAISEALAVFPVDLQHVLQTVVEQARRLAGAQYAALGIGTDSTVSFEPWVFSGMTAEQARAIGRFPRPMGVLGAVAHTGQVLRLADVRQHPASVGLPPHHPPIASFLGVPIRYRARSVGNLYLGNKLGAEAFSDDDQRAIELLAAHAGVALHRARIQFILESAPHGIVVVEAESGRLIPNAQAVELFGRRLVSEVGPAQLVGTVCRPDGRPLSLEEFPSSLAHQGQSIQNEELLVVRPDGARVPVLVSASPVRGPWAVELADVVMVFQDISVLKEVERLREEWTSVITHDLRQPITVITGHAGLLKRLIQQHNCPEQEASATEHIRTAASNLDRMIGDLYDAARIETRRLTLERQPVDLRALVCKVVDRLAQVTRGHPVRVEVKGEVPPAEADPQRLEQVLGNLLSNAAKYGYPSAEIQVEVERHGGEAQVAVTNQGPGVPPDELPHLFARFHRVRRAQTAGTPGLGLGLYISKRLIEAHGGRIWAESMPGETTTFRFTLPVAEQPA